MAMKGRPAPQLSEEELTAMGNAREKVMAFSRDAAYRTNRGRNLLAVGKNKQQNVNVSNLFY